MGTPLVRMKDCLNIQKGEPPKRFFPSGTPTSTLYEFLNALMQFYMPRVSKLGITMQNYS
jgi:hypothetical protein